MATEEMSAGPVAPVKFVVNVLARALLGQFRIPLAPAVLTQAQSDRLQATFCEAVAAFEATRDAIALEVQMTGACPWCGEARHDGACP